MSKQVKCCKCDESCPIHHAPVTINAEMLEALKDTLNCIYEMSKGYENPVDTGVIASAEAVIKKAEGA